MKLMRSLKNRILNSERSLRDRVFIVLTLAAIGMLIIGIIGDIFYGEYVTEILFLIGTFIMASITTYLGIVKNKVEYAARIISMGIIFCIMPGIFFMGGGPEGGTVSWLVFSYLYIGLVLDGKWRGASMILLTVEVFVMYYISYVHPEFVNPHDRYTFFMDSGLGVVEVGLVCCIMTWFQSWLMKEENLKAKEEAKKFEKLNRSQNRFFSSMSHEIRTPINSILGLNEIILRQEDASDEIIRDAGNIQGAGKMLLSLVNDILDFSKIEAGKMEIVPVNYSMSALISEMTNMIWLRAEQKGLKFVVEADPFLPSELFGDEVRIKQILINLLNNAVKYTKEGTVTLHIEMEETNGNEVSLVFSVSDTGIGIRQDDLPYLFDAFQRVDEERNRKIEGTGLGLSIVKQLVDLMGGKITVDSVYAQGSTFIVTLWQTVTNPKTIGDLSITGYGTVSNGNKYQIGFTAPEARVLIVDDNEINLEVEEKLLSWTKMHVDTVLSGEQAISLCLAHRYDMIFMDHLMPEMDGIQCMQRIRKQAGGLNNHAPIIVLTANAGSESRELYSRSGFDGYLVKPVSGKQLEESLLMYLPESKIIRNEEANAEETLLNTAQGYKRKIPVMITTSTMCDIPSGVLKENQIDIIPFTIEVNGKEYYDNIEVSTEELLHYRNKGAVLASKPPSVVEFEKFFGDKLQKAHQVIYLAVGSSISDEYEAAKEAAKVYGNVYVFNSGYNSASLGMMVLMAYMMSTQGKTPVAIIEELERIKSKVQCSFITNDSTFLVKRGMVGRALFAVMNTFGFKPILKVENDIFKMAGVTKGSLRTCYERYIEFALPRNANPDLDVIMVPYVSLNEDDLEWLRGKVQGAFKFRNIVFQRASAAMALNCGPGAFGLLYFQNGEYPCQIGNLFDEEKRIVTADSEDENFDEILKEEGHSETKDQSSDSEQEWYQQIPGIDGEVAIKNSGSEELFRMVLDIFYNGIDMKVEELNGLFDDNNWEDYTIKVHALKSSARLIGATSLSKEAEALEFAGKDNNTDFIRQNHGPLILHLSEYKETLSEFVKKPDEDESGKEEPTEEVVVLEWNNPVKVKEDDTSDEKSEEDEDGFDEFLIESIQESLIDGAIDKDAEMIESVFAEMDKYPLPEQYKEKMERLKVCFEKEDFNGMISILEEKDNE